MKLFACSLSACIYNYYNALLIKNQIPVTMVVVGKALIHITAPGLEDFGLKDLMLSAKITETSALDVADVLTAFVDELANKELLDSSYADLPDGHIHALQTRVRTELADLGIKVKAAEAMEAKYQKNQKVMTKMRNDYYRELSHLREQVYRTKQDKDFDPEKIFYYKADEYETDDQDIIKRMEQDIRMECNDKLMDLQERISVYKELVSSKAIQCEFINQLLQKLMVKHN